MGSLRAWLRRRPQAAVAEALDALSLAAGIHAYSLEIGPDRVWRVRHSSTNIARLIGAPPPPGVDLDEWYDSHVHPDDRLRYDAIYHYDRIAPGALVETAYRLRGADGVERHVLDRSRARAAGRGRFVLDGLIEDVTVERATEEALAGTRAHLERVVSNLSEWIYTMELVDGRRPYRTTFVGPNWERLLGRAPGELGSIAAVLLERVHPDDRAFVLAGADALERGEAIEQTYRMRTAEGDDRWVLDRVRPRPGSGGAIVDGIIIDVTEQRRAEQRVSDLVGSLELAVYRAVKRADGSFLAVEGSAGFSRLLGGGGPAANLDVDWRRAVFAGDRELYETTFAHATLARLEPVSCEYRLERADGEVRWVWERAFPRTVLPNGEIVYEGMVADVSERHQALRLVAEAEGRLHRVLEAVDQFVYTGEVVAGGGIEIVFRGPGDERLIGASVGGAPFGDAWAERIHRDDLAEHDAHIARLLRGEPSSAVYRLHGVDGVTRSMWARGFPRRTADVGRVVFDGIISDVTEREQASAEIQRARDEAERRSRVDPLTGVFNRAHFVEVLGGELNRGQREGTAPAVVLLDIDHFKRVNDTYLHAAGDEVLKVVARRIEAVLREYDTVARWGGEEFVVLLPGIADDEALRRLAELVREAASAGVIAIGDEAVAVTLSAGAARAGLGRFTVESLVDAADRALYSAKRRGRARVRLQGELTDSDYLMEEPDAIRIAEAMSRSAAVREGVPDLHSAQVADLASRVAQQLGLGPAADLRCRLGGWLHDVGKVAIPDRVLSKPGALDDDEWAVMRTHAAIGSEIIGRIPGLAEAAAIVRHHHERWDGAGYPDQLAGKGIPLEARILTAVDAFCAMTEDRVYRRGMDDDDALAELGRCAGSQLDPDVVSALLTVLAARPFAAADLTT